MMCMYVLKDVCPISLRGCGNDTGNDNGMGDAVQTIPDKMQYTGK